MAREARQNTTLTRYGRERAELRVPYRRPCFEPTPIYDGLARDARILAREKDRKPPEWLAMVRAEGRKQKRAARRLGFRRKEAKAEVIERDSFGKRLPSKRPVSAPAGSRKEAGLGLPHFGALAGGEKRKKGGLRKRRLVHLASSS